MRRWLPLVALLALPALPASAQAVVPVVELETNPTEYQGEQVTVVGEIVGDYGIREDFVWFQLNDDPYVEEPLAETGELQGTNVGIGVRVPRPVFDDGWGPPGGPGIRGPIVAVTGEFRYHDPDTGGETFIAADEVELVEPAREINGAPADPLPAIVGGVLGTLGVALFAFARLGSRR